MSVGLDTPKAKSVLADSGMLAGKSAKEGVHKGGRPRLISRLRLEVVVL